MRSSAAAGRGASPPLQGSSSASPAPAGRGRGAGGSPGPPAAFSAPRRHAESPWHFVAPVELRRENIVQYVGETRLDDGLRVAVQRLCSEEELPENPYMYLARQLRVLEPRDESWDRENEAILEELSNRVAVSDPVTTISHAEGDASFWGLPNVVRFVDLKRAPRLKDTLLKFVSKPAGTYDEYQVRVLPSLGGDYAFYGRLVPHPAELLLREAHVVEGPKLEAALNLFALNVLADAFALDEALHSVIGFVIEDEARGEGAARRWAMADMRERKAAFMGELKVAAVARRRLTAEVLAHLSAEEWETGAEPAMYVRLLKQYTFHFAASEERPAVLQASNYGPAPLEAVLDGVFLEKEDADAYVALHFDEDRRFTLGPSSRAFRAEMLARLFAAVRLNDQLSVARVALRLALMDGHFELVPSLHRMLASPAAALAATSATNATLQRLLAARGPPSKMEEMGRTLGAMYVSYAQRLSDVAASNSSSDVIALRPALAATLESLSGAAGAPGRPASLLLNEQTAPRLRRLRAMCEAVALTMAEDLAAGCLDVREYTRQCEAELQKLQVKLRQPPPAPTVVPMVVLVGEEVRALEGRRTVPRDQSREYVLATFLSDMLVDVRLTHILFNLLCDTLVPNPYPVLVRHLKAAGLRSQLRKGDDEAILSLARGQLALADAPRFIYSARSAAAPGSAAALAAGPGQQAAGAQCFGLASALAFADPLLLAALRVGLRALFLAAPPPLQGYECTVRGALAGHAVVMGRLVRMEPGLPLGLLERVDVVEELRVTGPSVELALHLAASTIASHAERVALSSPHVVEALEAHGAARFGAREVVQQRDAVVASLSQALRLGQRVSLRGVALVGETYLPFEQFFHVHYINPSSSSSSPPSLGQSAAFASWLLSHVANSAMGHWALAALASLALSFLVPPLQDGLKLTPLPAHAWGTALCAALLVLVIGEAAKLALSAPMRLAAPRNEAAAAESAPLLAE
eukprot:tig00000402_g206.t1